MSSLACRFCSAPLTHVFADLGMSPLSNAYLDRARLHAAESFYPLVAYVCHECFLVQVPEVVSPEVIFSDYAYFSSYSDSWLAHVDSYAETMTERLGLDHESLVVEVASNDGCLLQAFQRRGVPVLGIEPAANVAAEAERRGVPTLVRFFGAETALELVAEGRRARLLVGNNVLAHVPDLNGFVAGLSAVLAPDGILTVEVPHLLRLVDGNEFDTIYHEHFCYFSLLSLVRVFAAHGLEVFDVDELPVHGGSLRIYARHDRESAGDGNPSVERLLQKEVERGYGDLPAYLAFAAQVKATKRKILSFLIAAREQGHSIAAYGAPAKGNTLLNYCGIGTDFLDFTVDRNPHKQGKFLPGSHVPILSPDHVFEARPDILWILPWNLRDEISRQMEGIQEWGGRFLVAIPRVEVWP